MSLKTWLVFLLAIASGMFAILGIFQLRQRQASKETATVVVVRKSIGRGFSIPAESVELLSVPREFVSPTMVKTLKEVVGRIATTSLLEGEFVLTQKVVKAGSRGSGIASLIPSGLRAYSIQATNSANRVSGLLQSGDRVDVMLTRGGQSGQRESSAKSESLIQNVEVLAIDKNIEQATNKSSTSSTSSKPEAKTSTVTLLVTPKQASILGLGQKQGILSLALRNPEDTTITEDTEVSELELMDQTDLLSAAKSPDGIDQGSDEATTAETTNELQGEVPEEATTLTLEEMQILLNAPSLATKSRSRFSAIRTIRGSRLGVIPIHSVTAP